MEQFTDIFTKIEKLNYKPLGLVTEVWKKISPTIYQCKITGRKMNNTEFFRYQTAIGFEKFIVEVLK
jgi:hypothetical protein